MNEKIAIEVLDQSNRWLRTTTGILNTAQSINRSMQEAKRMYPKLRVRAIGHSSGFLYDMLP